MAIVVCLKVRVYFYLFILLTWSVWSVKGQCQLLLSCRTVQVVWINLWCDWVSNFLPVLLRCLDQCCSRCCSSSNELVGDEVMRLLTSCQVDWDGIVRGRRVWLSVSLSLLVGVGGCVPTIDKVFWALSTTVTSHVVRAQFFTHFSLRVMFSQWMYRCRFLCCFRNICLEKISVYTMNRQLTIE